MKMINIEAGTILNELFEKRLQERGKRRGECFHFYKININFETYTCSRMEGVRC